MSTGKFYGAVLSALLFSGSEVQAAPVGMAAQVSGAVSVEKNGKKKPLRLLGRLEAGDVVVSGAGARAVVVLFGGSRFQIGPNTRATIASGNVAGAQKMAALAGPSASAVQLLSSARVGAVMARPAVAFQRLLPDFPGYLIGKTPQFNWIPIPNAGFYTFTLFDSADNVVWSVSTSQTSTNYPTGVAPMKEKVPYLWKLSAFNAAGQALEEGRWGVVTTLSSEDAQLLKERVAAFQDDVKVASEPNATDKTAILLLVETYRSFGVVNNALEVLEDQKVLGWTQAEEARNEIIDSLSPFTRSLAGRVAPAPSPTNF